MTGGGAEAMTVTRKAQAFSPIASAPIVTIFRSNLPRVLAGPAVGFQARS